LKIEDKIFLNKEVSNINWDNDKNLVEVTCSDGNKYEAEQVIVTVSLAVLKHDHERLFTPHLPENKVNAIQGISMGTVDKIFIEFEKPFWPESWSGFSMIWSKEDIKEIGKSKHAWIKDVFGIYRMSYQPNVLCGFISGESARHMEKLDNSQVLEGIMIIFEKFLEKHLDYTAPKKILTSKWFSNPYVRGGYSYRSLKTDALKTTARKLAEPVFNSKGKPVILFAGEATNDHHYSTVHGAVESGYREADRIVKIL
jgi:spermine oxidase